MTLYIKQSGVSGFGAFSSKNIKKGETICFMEGKEISIYELKEAIKQKNKKDSGDFFQIESETYIDLEEKYRCINHSCNPNTYLRDKNELVALRDINEDEEIFYDYSTTMWENKEKIKSILNEELWTLKCLCGSSNCRNIIGQFFTLNKQLQDYYVTNGFVQDFILEKFNLNKISNFKKEI